MRTKRRLHLSLYYEIKNILVREGFVASVQGEELQRVSDNLYRAQHNDWVYQDLSKYPVNVYNNGVLVSEEYYTRDFRNGTIQFTISDLGIVTCDYTYNQIKMRQAYPPQDTLKIEDLPLLVVVPRNVPRYPMAIGGQIHQSEYNFTIDFFGQSLGQMEDVTDALEAWLLETPEFYERSFSSGFPLLDNGEINPDYADDQFRKYYKVEVTGTPFIAEGMSDVEKFRYAIDFILMDYRNFKRD